MKHYPRYIILFLLGLIITAFRGNVNSVDRSEEINKMAIKVDTPWGEEIFTEPQFPEATFNIRDFGAKAEEGFNNQSYIQDAINACHKNGGGKVFVPAGTWFTAYLDLKSNVNLNLDENAIISFSDSIDLYAKPTLTRWEGIECMNYHPLIYAKDAENIAITGKGRLDGNGSAWWYMKKEKKQIITLTKLYDAVLSGVEPESRNCLDMGPISYLRPSFIQTINCRNVLFEDFEIGSGPMWTIHPVYSENVIARNLKVITKGRNNDGIIPDACKKVLIENCFFSTGDDCIVIKSGLNEDGWRVNRPSERIIIRNCKTEKGHGGIVIGSEMSGGVKNIYAYDCELNNTDKGIRVKSMKGRGGYVKNIWIDNVKMDNIKREAIIFNMKYSMSSIMPKSDSLPIFQNLNFSNITSTNSEYGIKFIGLEEANINNIHIENVSLSSRSGVEISNASDIQILNSTFSASSQTPIIVENFKNFEISNLEYHAPGDTLFHFTDNNSSGSIRSVNSHQYEIPFAGVNPKITITD